LNELPLPFVNDLKHLGNVLQSDNSMTIDCNKKRAIFILKIHSLNQEFYFNSPDVILKLYNIYCYSFYGSSIWDLSSQCVSKLYTAWNTAIRILCNLPKDTHRHLIESISQCLHVKTMLATRCVSFYETIEALDFFLIYVKLTLTQFLAEIYFLLQMIVL